MADLPHGRGRHAAPSARHVGVTEPAVLAMELETMTTDAERIAEILDAERLAHDIGEDIADHGRA